MINFEQVKLLESKVAKAVDYVERLSKENAALHRQEAELQTRLESYQKRIDELEILVLGFKEDQGRIEEGILAALDRLNQFEKAIEKSLKDKPAGAKGTAAHTAKPPQTAQQTTEAKAAQDQTVVAEAAEVSGDGQTCFEIPEGADGDDTSGDDIPDPLEGSQDKETSTEELDIF